MAATKFQLNYKKEEELDLLCITSKANRIETEENYTDDRCLLRIKHLLVISVLKKKRVE